MGADVRYCRTEDGVQIGYTVYGTGPALVITPYFCESFDNDRSTPIWAEYYEGLTAGYQIVRYDQRGTGVSQRDVADVTAYPQTLDLEAVVKTVGLERFSLYGSVLGGSAAMIYAARHPEQVDRLALYAAFARGVDVMPRETMQSLATLCRSNYQMASQVIADMSARLIDAALGLTLAELLRANVGGEILGALFEDETDLSDVVDGIRCPTLLLHRTHDSAVPMATSKRLASLIPDARLVTLPGESNYPPLGDWKALTDAVRAFIPPAAPAVAPAPAEDTPSGFRAILFTDLVGHTTMMHRLGDEKGRAVLREHETLTREVLKQNSGSEVKTMGDGFLASFTSVTRAVECAIALQKAIEARNATANEPLNVRVGLNAGEPIEEDGDLFGETVIMAARIAAMAQGGEILSSLGVRELCGGKGFLFADRGEHVMKGFEDAVRVFEISWRG
jgi:class 3 adenylate cyclase/pimeloyl-ACP methyl ester carboxylesterase